MTIHNLKKHTKYVNHQRICNIFYRIFPLSTIKNIPFSGMSLTNANDNHWTEELPLHLPTTKPSHGESRIAKFFGIKKRGAVKVIHVSHADKVKLRSERRKTARVKRARSSDSCISISNETGRVGPCEGGQCSSSPTARHPQAKTGHSTEPQQSI